MHTDPKSLIFTLLQLLAIIYILISGPVFMDNIPFLLIQIFGLLIVGWAFLAKKINTYKHASHLPKGAFLVMKGPYEIIRHPIYAGMLLIMIGYVQGYISIPRFFAFAILLAVTLMKLEYDENIMRNHHHEYEAYRAKTHKLIPYFY